MSNDLITRTARVDEATTEQAQKAVRVFRSLQPTLSAYARALTGRSDVRVDMAAKDNGSTDGKRIFFRPPLALGDNTPHDNKLCDKRNSAGLMTCPACAVREEVLVTIYHEIAHICYESFAATTDDARRRAINFAIGESETKWARQIEERIEKAPSYMVNSYMGLATLINEYLPYLLNCLEDARVNRELFKARPGVLKMFHADVAKVFEEGYERIDSDGKAIIQSWKEAPLNSQAMVGTFCKASGYDYTDWFHPKVAEALDDPELTELIQTMDSIRSAGAVYNLSFKVLARLRDLGFCGTPQDPDPEPEPEPEAEPEPEPEPEEDESDEPEPEEEPEPDPDSDSSDGDSDEGESPDSDPVSEEPGEGDSPERPDDSDDGAESEVSEDSTGVPGPDGQDSSGGDGSSDDDPEGESESPEAGSGSDASPDESDGDSHDDPDEDSDGEPNGDSSDPRGDSSETEGGEDGSSEREGLLSEGGAANLDGGDAAQAEADSDSTDTDESDESVTDEESALSDDDPDPVSEPTEPVNPVDAGADDGYGGTETTGDGPDENLPPMGTPDDIEEVLKEWGHHEEKPKTAAEARAEDAVDRAIVQGIYFTNPSAQIFGVREHHYDAHYIADDGTDYSVCWDTKKLANSRIRAGGISDTSVPEQILQPALLKMRRAFTDNRRGSSDTNRRSGRINSRVLGKRAGIGDERLFVKKTSPGKKDYFVVIGMDLSGSTIGRNLALEKRAIMAQATLLDRMGIDFAVYGHTGNYHDGYDTSVGLDLDVYHIKDSHENWNDKTKERLENIGPSAANLDGHAMEFLRKRLDESRATDKILMYYSDGKMPAENHDEELEILTQEIKTCRNKGYTLMGVGIRTDSPARHGLDTVQVDSMEDIAKVVTHLGKRLAK